MVAIMRCRPQYHLLGRGQGHECDEKLETAAGFVRAMRKITVITGSDKKHAPRNQRQARNHVSPAEFNEENSQREQMNGDKWQRKGYRNSRTAGEGIETARDTDAIPLFPPT